MQALGCLLYYLLFGKLAFQAEAKLQILNGDISVPPSRPPPLIALLRELLVVNPAGRPDIIAVLRRLQEVAEALNVDPALLVPRNPTPPTPCERLTFLGHTGSSIDHIGLWLLDKDGRREECQGRTVLSCSVTLATEGQRVLCSAETGATGSRDLVESAVVSCASEPAIVGRVACCSASACSRFSSCDATCAICSCAPSCGCSQEQKFHPRSSRCGAVSGRWHFSPPSAGGNSCVSRLHAS